MVIFFHTGLEGDFFLLCTFGGDFFVNSHIFEFALLDGEFFFLTHLGKFFFNFLTALPPGNIMAHP